MRKLLLASAGLGALALAAPAWSADLAPRTYTKAPAPMIAAAYDWSGFYLGINGGGGWTRDNRTNDTLGVPLGSYTPSGGVVGGQIGYRWQSSGWVFGLEAQGDWADISGSTQSLAIATNNLSSKMDAFGLFTGQIGYAWENVLLYAKGGAAVTDRRYDFVSNVTGLTLASADYSTQWGGTVGAGLEVGFGPNWSVGIEYDHIFEDRHNVTFISAATGLPLASSFSSGGDTDLVTARINYRFGGPVIAKY